jgi:hypothetical protein
MIIFAPDYAKVNSNARKSASLTFSPETTDPEQVRAWLMGYGYHFTNGALACLKVALGQVRYIESGQPWGGRVVGFPQPSGGWHVCDLSKPHSDRWRFTDDGKTDLLVVNRDPAEPLVIFEGEWDLLTALSIGVPNGATGTGGARNFKRDWVRRFKDRDTVICYDVDPEGRKGAEGLARLVSGTSSRVRTVTLPLDGTATRKDFRDWVGAGGTRATWDGLVEAACIWTTPMPALMDDTPATDPTSPLAMPQFPESAWRGLFGRWRELVAPCSEAPAVLHFLTFAAVTGLILRRRVCFRYPHPHYPNFYGGFVGSTGDAHKSTALWFGEELARDLGMPLNIVSGVSSPEGLLERIGKWEKDESGQRLPVPAPPALLYCDELGVLLAKARLEATAGILPKLTRLYDCPPKDENPSLWRPLVVLEPTIGLLTGTTRDTLDRGLRDSDLTDGFLNRVVWVTSADHPEPISEPHPPDQGARNKLLCDLRVALDHWSTGTAEIPLDSAASEAWRDIYNQWKRNRDVASPSFVLKATARTHTHIRKLALLGGAL